MKNEVLLLPAGSFSQPLLTSSCYEGVVIRFPVGILKNTKASENISLNEPGGVKRAAVRNPHFPEVFLLTETISSPSPDTAVWRSPRTGSEPWRGR